MKKNKIVIATLIVLFAIACVFIFIFVSTDNKKVSAGSLNTASASEVSIIPIETPPLPTATEQALSTAPAETIESSEPSIDFVESAELKLPSMTEDLQCGQVFHLRGTVKSTSPLKKITVSVSAIDFDMTDYVNTSTFPDDVYSYSFEKSEQTSDGIAICDKIQFETLKPGKYKLNISGVNAADSQPVTIVTSEFQVVKSEWIQLISNNFRENYSHALSFFGDEKRFLFKYKWGEGRNITIDQEWVKKYIKTIKGLNGQKWTMHVDAIPYFENAINYLKNTYVRVKSNTHDTGVIQLSKLIKSYNGLYVSRYVTDRTFISHHSFGTAIDINAGIDVNKNLIDNQLLIETEVKDNLTYNGIKKENGRSCYDFTYKGDTDNYYKSAPATVINYLLYELAFYRAGFGWGYYYSHTCDAMHFTLSEFDISIHDNGLRKVTTYIDD